jgi:YfiH family protein
MGLPHAFSCRDLDPAAPGHGSVGPMLARAEGLDGLPTARLRQRHTALVHRADGPAAEKSPPVGDGLVSIDPGWVLTLRTADCLPILLLDPATGAYAAVHAGWKGTEAGVLAAALELLRRAGVATSSLWMAVGPCIRLCCYEIGDEVAARFEQRWDAASSWLRPGERGRPHLDLVAANRWQASAAGMRPGRVLDPGICTRCRRDLFFSYRADGAGTGRIVTVAGRRAPAD